MKLTTIGFLCAMVLDCAAFGYEMRTHYLERLAAYNAGQASQAAEIWHHDIIEGKALVDAFKVQ